MSAKPGLPTSTVVHPIDVAHTEQATHVYVKVDEPKGLSSKFEGPFLITSRPSRSTVQVRVGSFVDGTPRLQVFNWSSCKIAHLRPDSIDFLRPNIGRKSKDPEPTGPVTPPPFFKLNKNDATSMPAASTGLTASQQQQADGHATSNPQERELPVNSRPIRSTRNPSPNYINFIAKPA